LRGKQRSSASSEIVADVGWGIMQIPCPGEARAKTQLLREDHICWRFTCGNAGPADAPSDACASDEMTIPHHIIYSIGQRRRVIPHIEILSHGPAGVGPIDEDVNVGELNENWKELSQDVVVLLHVQVRE